MYVLHLDYSITLNLMLLMTDYSQKSK